MAASAFAFCDISTRSVSINSSGVVCSAEHLR
jgi:hypothetical protein